MLTLPLKSAPQGGFVSVGPFDGSGCNDEFGLCLRTVEEARYGNAVAQAEEIGLIRFRAGQSPRLTPAEWSEVRALCGVDPSYPDETV